MEWKAWKIYQCDARFVGIVNSEIKIYLFFVFYKIYVKNKFYLLIQELTNSNFQGTLFTALHKSEALMIFATYFWASKMF
jgi:hypothetical protein